MDTKQPNALRLADALGRAPKWQQFQAAAEMRRLHAENDTLRTGYDAARLEIESLQARIQELGLQARECSDRKVVKLDARIKDLEAQLDAVGAGGVELLRKRECLHHVAEQAQIDSDMQRDAERYRWLRKSPNPACDIKLAEHFSCSRGEDFDAKIDAARAAQGGAA